MFEDAPSLAQQLVHGGADNAEFSFAFEPQARCLGMDGWIMRDGGQGWKVERAPQGVIADRGETFGGILGARLMTGRSETTVGSRRPGSRQSARQFGQNDRGGEFSDARDAKQQFPIAEHPWIQVQAGQQLGLQFVDLFFEQPDEALDGGFSCAALGQAGQTVAFAGQIAFARLQ